MSRYAEKTNVPVARSKAEIERVLVRYGAAVLRMSGAELNDQDLIEAEL